MTGASVPLQRVLIVTPHYPPRSLGGTQLRARKMARWLSARGLCAEVVCVEDITPGPTNGLVGVRSEEFEGVLVHRLDLTSSRSRDAFRWSYDHPQIEAYLSELVAERQPDVIHLISGYLVTPAAIRVGKIRGIPTVVTITDYWFVCPRINLIRSNGRICSGPHSTLDCTRCLLSESRRYRLPEKLLPSIAGFLWRVVSTSDCLKNSISFYSEVARRERFLVDVLNQADAVTIPSNSLRPGLTRAGVQDRFYLSRHSIAAEELGIQPENFHSPSRAFRFGCLGNLLYAKGIDLLLEAYRQLVTEFSDISLAIWGDSEGQTAYTTELRNLVTHLPGASLRGRYEPSQIGAILRDIDMLIVPSRCPEIGPFVILEAFATHTPVIAARIGNMPELVEHDVNGLLFTPDSVGDLRSQMHRIFEEPDLCMRLRSGIPRVRTMQDEMSELIAIYRSMRQARDG